jgi:hypothetical protein
VSAIWSGRSAFTQGLGFNKVNDLTMDDPSVGEVLGLKAKKLRGLFMRLGSDRNAPMLDLVQFIDPPPHGQPYPTLTNIGICRIAFTRGRYRQNLRRAEGEKDRMPGATQEDQRSNGAVIGVVCFMDPDGTILELISGSSALIAPRASPSS